MFGPCFEPQVPEPSESSLMHDRRIAIGWSIDRGPTPARLHLRWEESGGPPVEPPCQRGFGSRLIERSLALDLGGAAGLAFAPTGIVCTIDAPIA